MDLIFRVKLIIIIININITYIIINKCKKKYYYDCKKIVIESHLGWARLYHELRFNKDILPKVT